MKWLSRLEDWILDRIDGPVNLSEVIPPWKPTEHRDHLEKCPECQRHYICREIVCRLVCASCAKKYEAADHGSVER